MVSIRFLEEEHPSHYQFDPHTTILFSVQIPEVSGKYPIEDGRELGVEFDLRYHPARVIVFCHKFPELRGKKGVYKRTVQIGSNGVGRNRVKEGVVLEVDLEREVHPTPEAYSQALASSSAGRSRRQPHDRNFFKT